jgi:hypothetical protein
MKNIILITVIINFAITFIASKTFLKPQESTKIYIADFAEVKRGIIGKIANKKDINESDLRLVTNNILDQFQDQVRALAKEQNAIIIDDRASIGNAKDVTEDLERLAHDLIVKK